MSSNPKSGPEGADDPLFPDDQGFGASSESADAATEVPSQDDSEPGAVKRSAGWLSKVKPIYVVALAAAGWTAWILGGDYVASSTQQGGPLQASALSAPAPAPLAAGAPLDKPLTSVTPKAIVQQPIPDTRSTQVENGDSRAPLRAAVDTSPYGDVEDLPDTLAIKPDDETVQEDSERERKRAARPTLREMELQAKITRLEGQIEDMRIGEGDAKLQKMQADLSAMGEKLALLDKKLSEIADRPAQASKAPQPKPAGRLAPKTTPSAPPKPSPRATAPVAGFRLNTVYANQAWVDSGDRTYIVQVGDRLGAARVTRIDAKERRVYTDAGVIK